jgi:hypothetical protein
MRCRRLTFLVVVTNLSRAARAEVDEALAAVCRQAGIAPAGARLIRYTMNAVYRIDAAAVVIRMAPGPGAQELVDRVVRVAAAFQDYGLPTTRLASDIQQPIHANGWAASVWQLLPQPQEHRFQPRDLAEPLRLIHQLPTSGVELPRWDPVNKARRRLAQLDVLGKEDDSLRRWADEQVGVPLATITRELRYRCDDLGLRLDQTRWSRPSSVIHGDAHTGNLLLNRAGRSVLGDLDSVAIGPPEWDLTPAAHGTLRFGDDPRRYSDFVDAYGVDVTTVPAWPTLCAVRDLQLATSVMANLPGRPDVAAELAHRIRTTLTGDMTARWHRHV